MTKNLENIAFQIRFEKKRRKLVKHNTLGANLFYSAITDYSQLSVLGQAFLQQFVPDWFPSNLGMGAGVEGIGM